jgi:rhamnosyltransferase
LRWSLAFLQRRDPFLQGRDRPRAPAAAKDRFAKICAVVVSHHPELKVLEAVISAIRPQAHHLVVVDNGSSVELVEGLRALAIGKEFHLIASDRNLGVAAGHNIGMGWAREQRCTHVVLLDQDSVAEKDMVSGLVAAHRQLTAQGIAVSAVGPLYRDPVSGHSSFFVRSGFPKPRRIYCALQGGDQYIEADFLITSGSLISLSTIDAVGAMDDALFIDHVDTEWFLRASKKGYRAFGVCGAVMHHTLGSETLRVWLGRWRYVPRHSPLRHYYIFRNSILLYKRSYVPGIWIFNDVVRLGFMLVFYPLRTPPRGRHALMMIKGILDGLKGRTGPLDATRSGDSSCTK